MIKRTFIDAGVLILAARGSGSASARALSLLAQPDRELCSSIFIKLEVLPKAIYHRRKAEIDFYNAFFNSVNYWAVDLDKITQEAEIQAATFGLSGMDALHVAAALSLNADEMITSEKNSKPIFRVSGLKVVSIQP